MLLSQESINDDHIKILQMKMQALLSRQIPWSRLFSALYLRGGSRLQLLPLATFEPRLVQVGQCAWELG